eukprot:772861-Pyramimonas_sp.AAC.1
MSTRNEMRRASTPFVSHAALNAALQRSCPRLLLGKRPALSDGFHLSRIDVRSGVGVTFSGQLNSCLRAVALMPTTIILSRLCGRPWSLASIFAA